MTTDDGADLPRGSGEETAGLPDETDKTPSGTRAVGRNSNDGNAEFEPIPDEQLSDAQFADISTLLRGPELEPYNPSQALDKARIRVAMWLLRVLILVIVLNAVLLSTARLTGIAIDDVRSLFETMFGSMVTLVSAATGFYFGTRVNDSGGDRDRGV